MSAKSMIDQGMNTAADIATDAQAAAMLAQGHPKSKVAPVAFGMKDGTNDGDGADDDARVKSFAKD